MSSNKEVFNKLLQENRGIIIKICNTYCQSKADKEDLAQEIVYNLWHSFANFKPDFKISTWMYQVALNVAISYYRKSKRSIQFEAYSEELIVFEEDNQPKTEKEANLAKLDGFIQELKEIDKSIVLLYLDNKSYKEIAEILGMSESNVATKLNRIKQNLKTKFTKN